MEEKRKEDRERLSQEEGKKKEAKKKKDSWALLRLEGEGWSMETEKY